MELTAEETVFSIPELRRYILGYYLEKKVLQRKKPKTCKEKANEVAKIPVQCCCVGYLFFWILYKTRCLTLIFRARPS